jgi:hypothetical protein
MAANANISRTVGILLILHLAVGLMIPFIMLQTVTSTGGFLANAADNATRVRLAVLLLTFGSAMALAVSAAAAPTFQRYSTAMTYWLLALAIAGFTLQSVDNGRILSMLSLSQQYAAGGKANSELFQSLAGIVGPARKWAHYTYLLVAVSWILLLFAMLFRFRLVPRAISILGIIATLMQIGGVTIRAMWGYPPATTLAMPLAPVYLAVAGWLIVKGFREQETRGGVAVAVPS